MEKGLDLSKFFLRVKEDPFLLTHFDYVVESCDHSKLDVERCNFDSRIFLNDDPVSTPIEGSDRHNSPGVRLQFIQTICSPFSEDDYQIFESSRYNFEYPIRCTTKTISKLPKTDEPAYDEFLRSACKESLVRSDKTLYSNLYIRNYRKGQFFLKNYFLQIDKYRKILESLTTE